MPNRKSKAAAAKKPAAKKPAAKKRKAKKPAPKKKPAKKTPRTKRKPKKRPAPKKPAQKKPARKRKPKKRPAPKPPAPPVATPRPTASEALDRELAAKALAKRRAGQTPTVRELAALRRVEADKDEKEFWQHVTQCTKKRYIQMTGRQHKVLSDQAAAHGLPITGTTINLADVLARFHDILAEHKAVLRAARENVDGQPRDSPLHMLRIEKAAKARLEREALERTLLPRDDVHAALLRFADIIRGAGGRLQRQAGPAAADILIEALDDCERFIERTFGKPVHSVGSRQKGKKP